MTRRIWLRCLLISVFATVAVLPLTMIALVPAEGEEVVDLRAIDGEKVNQLSDEEFAEYAKSIPMRRLHGWERFTYWFTGPNWFSRLLLAYWRAGITWFLLFFVSTASVSYLNERDRRG